MATTRISFDEAGQHLGVASDTPLPVSDHNADRNTGLIEGQLSRRKFGRNFSVGTSDETVWTYSANWIPTQIASTIRVKAGGNANDTAAGTGARTISLIFLDDSWNEVTETLTLAGASASAVTSALCRRLISAKVVYVGTYHGSNEGDIIIEQTTGGAIMGNMDLGKGTTEQSIYTVPAGYTMYVTDIFVGVGQGNSADVHLVTVADADNVVAPFNAAQDIWGVEDYSGAQVFPFVTYLVFNEKTDVWFKAKKVTGGGTAQVAVDFGFYLKANS